MEIWVINPPSGFGLTREGRCMQRKEMWSSLWPPTSVAYIASVLREKGYGVKAFDCVADGTSKEYFLTKKGGGSPGFVIVNTSTPTIDGDMAFVRYLKAKFPRSKIAVFGTHPSALPQNCLDSGADIAIIGEPEISAVIIAEATQKGNNNFDGASIAIKSDDGTMFTSQSGFLSDLDSLPFPAWDLFDLSRYTMPGKDMVPKKFLTITPSRGCPYSCSFCNASVYYGKKARFRNPKNIVEEIERNINQFGVTDFLIWAESFTLDPQMVGVVCDEISRRKLNVDWVCNSRVNMVNPILLRKMKRAGCWLISFGIESGEQKILNRANKTITPKDSIYAVRIAREVGIKTVAHTIIGLPGETPDSVKKTGKLLNKADVDFAQFYCAVPFPGSYLYEEARKEGWINKEAIWTDFEQTNSVMNIPTMSSSEVLLHRRNAYIRHFINPGRIIRILKGVSWRGALFAAKSAVLLFISGIKIRKK